MVVAATAPRDRYAAALLAACAAGALVLASGTCMLGISGLIRPLAWPAEVSPEAWLLYLAVVTAALALLAFSCGAARLSPTALTVAPLVEPLTAVALSALLLGQILSRLQWLGGALLMASIWGLSARESRQPARSAI